MSGTMPHNIYTIDPLVPDPGTIAAAANIIDNGGVVVFPTQSLYGLAANALDEDAVDRVFQIKRRPPEKPVLVLIGSISVLNDLVSDVSTSAERIMNAWWPGGVTLVFHSRPDLPPNLTAGTGKIGVRLPLHPVARLFVKHVQVPITGTSANLSGQPGCRKIDEIDSGILERAGMTLDAGPLIGGQGSTVVDVTVTPPKILREGLVPGPRILETISGL